MPAQGDTIVVWFSCGAASAVAALLTAELYGARCNVRVVNNPVIEEDSDNLRFGDDVEQALGLPIELALHPSYPHASAERVWKARRAMSFRGGAPCTTHLKREARQYFERDNLIDWNVLGFTADEVKRHERFVLTERANVLPVLIDAGLTKEDCARVLVEEYGIALPRVYAQGYPNANCIGCVKATSATYWNHVRAQHPEVFERRAAVSRELGVRLVRYKGVRLFLDELPEDAVGRPMKTLALDCGTFCEEL